MRLRKIILGLTLVCILTAVTQIGGFVFLISFLTFGLIDNRLSRRWTRVTAKVLSFATLYLVFVFLIVPPTAKSFGRVPLPVFENRNLKPASIWTCLLNRNYVRPQLRDITYKVAEGMNNKFPGTTINYLDANFPFINKFPLLPHLSHNDGKKLDLSFQYNDRSTGLLTNDIPSFIGYGVCEEPKDGEENKPEDCDKKGYWQYNLLRNYVSQANKNKFTFDNKRTKELVNSFASHEGLGKIFIEPHLKTRLGLTSSKIRFHGCQAVRHDDHIHVQLK
jgi:energy-coupling factor transporter transmembrane protein EcfT